ncbi:hypothetical protein KFE25_008090 [Diacronema lutheri]|uniref:Tyrosinase copper-binding domain-containing protein n=2 Tax=Diacronema lutheri TaxID=2081491 RepID=A0A8J5XMZ9_DIALT|nr:hypothetical protein KFE25_008090 [Diacronema lutheri]
MLACFGDAASALKRPRVRESLEVLQAKYEAGDTKPLVDVWRAFRALQALPPDDEDSFFAIGRLAFDDGSCRTSDVLFPAWSRALLLRLEDALISHTPECAGLPFWDETSSASMRLGVPWCVTRAYVEIDGAAVPNPLASFLLPRPLRAGTAGAVSSRPTGYSTVRFPYGDAVAAASGDLAASVEAERTVVDELRARGVTSVELLNQSVRVALHGLRTGGSLPDERLGSVARLRAALDAPTFLLFAHKAAADEYNGAVASAGGTAVELVSSLSTHFSNVALAAGGHSGMVPGFPRSHGELSSADTASLDPLFFLHLAFCDYALATWQARHGATRSIEVEGEEGPLRVSAARLNEPLAPFRRSALAHLTSRDVASIALLRYSYAPASLDLPPPVAMPGGNAPVLVVKGLSRHAFTTSFTVFAYAELPGTFFSAVRGDMGQRVRLLGFESVFSHPGAARCASCQRHAGVTFLFPLYGLTDKQVAKAVFFVRVADSGEYATLRTPLAYKCYVNGMEVRSAEQLPGGGAPVRRLSVRRPSMRAANV